MIILHDAVHFPSEHSFSHVTTLMLSYGWECVLFGCYNEIGSEHGHYAVNQASCVIGERFLILCLQGIDNMSISQMKMSV